MYDIPKTAIPKGMAYQWVRASVAGDPDEARLSEAAAAGWVPVPWERHKDLFPRWRTDDGFLEGYGLRLMERPAALDAREREDERSAIVLLAGLGHFHPEKTADEPRVEKIRLDLFDWVFRRRYRAVIEATAHALCRDDVMPLRVVMIASPRHYRLPEAVAPFYGFEEPQSVLAWRLFEPRAIEIVRSVVADAKSETSDEDLVRLVDQRLVQRGRAA